MNMMVTHLASDELRARYDLLKNTHPTLPRQHYAQHLRVQEAELVAAECRARSTELKPPFHEVMAKLHTLGEVQVLSLNRGAQMKCVGCYDCSDAGGIGLVLSTGVDLRLNFSAWGAVYAVEEPAEFSVQVFNRQGMLVHKISLNEAGAENAYQVLISTCAQPYKRMPVIEPASAEHHGLTIDDEALRQHWLSLWDTYEFLPMLNHFNITRLSALRFMEADLAQEVNPCTLSHALKVALSLRIPIKYVFESQSVTHQYTGVITYLNNAGQHLKVANDRFELGLNLDIIDSVWVVNVPTRDSVIVTLEAYAITGELIIQLASDRAADESEQHVWQQLLTGFCQELMVS